MTGHICELLVLRMHLHVSKLSEGLLERYTGWGGKEIRLGGMQYELELSLLDRKTILSIDRHLTIKGLLFFFSFIITDNAAPSFHLYR